MPTQEHLARRYNKDGTVNHHASHHHHGWGLSCDDFEAMLDAAGRACQICGRGDVFLQIDHERVPGMYPNEPIRGLLCPKCNTHMHMIDSGKWPTNEKAAAYLKREPTVAWSCFLPPDLIAEVTVRAAERGESVSDVVRRALARYARRSK